MNATDIELALRPILDEIEKRSVLVDPFVDKETYRIYLATLWSNLVLKPEEAGLLEEDLEAAHDIINIQAQDRNQSGNAFLCLVAEDKHGASDLEFLSTNSLQQVPGLLDFVQVSLKLVHEQYQDFVFHQLGQLLLVVLH